jgi:hypothetical protein
VALLSTLAFFTFNASSIMWWGGWGIGPRYLLPALPFMALAIAFVFAPRRGERNAYGAPVWLKAFTLALAMWSLIATWGLTLAEQSFPPDTLFNPLVEYALPNWQTGNIARNIGTLLGFKGVASLLPLMVIFALIALGWWKAATRLRADGATQPLKAEDDSTSTRRDLTWIQQ